VIYNLTPLKYDTNYHVTTKRSPADLDTLFQGMVFDAQKNSTSKYVSFFSAAVEFWMFLSEKAVDRG
jgi:hypothetical protein